jgi:hypothetical protein
MRHERSDCTDANGLRMACTVKLGESEFTKLFLLTFKSVCVGVYDCACVRLELNLKTKRHVTGEAGKGIVIIKSNISHKNVKVYR